MSVQNEHTDQNDRSADDPASPQAPEPRAEPEAPEAPGAGHAKIAPAPAGQTGQAPLHEGGSGADPAGPATARPNGRRAPEEKGDRRPSVARGGRPLELEAPKPADPPAGDGTGRPRPPSEDAQNNTQFDEYSAEEKARKFGREQVFDRSASASGPDGKAFYFEHFTQHVTVGDRRIRVSRARIRDAARDACRETYVAVDGIDQMADTLVRRRLVILSGPSGTGRHATAVYLLSRAPQSGWLGRLETEPDELGDVIGRNGGPESGATPIEKDDRLVVDLLGRSPTDGQWAALAEEAYQKSAFVVVVAPPTPTSGDAYPREFCRPHGRPDPAAVLRRNLAYQLTKHRSACDREDCTDERLGAIVDARCAVPEVDRYLRIARSLDEVAGLAAVLADHVHTADAEVPGLLGSWKDRLRTRAEELLAASSGPSEKEERLLLRRQVFRIAYAVFHGHPFSDVFSAGDWLMAAVTQQAPNRVRLAEVPRLIVDGKVRELLGTGMSAVDEAAVNGTDGPRRAQLVDGDLVVSILDVAWHDYHTLRGPLLDWLQILALHPQVRVRVRAAQTAGLLARFDFDEVYGQLLRGWAEGPAFTRAAAADALDIAHRSGFLAARVRRQVRDWALSPKAQLQDSAARAYGSVTGVADPAEAIRALADLGTRRALADWSSIALAMVQLSDAGAPTQVLDALTEWIRSGEPTLRDHAVRAMLQLTRLAAGENSRSPLVRGLSDRRDTVIRLWRRALADERTSRRAWDQFRQWLRSAERRPEDAAGIEALAVDILDHPLDARARFWLTLWAERHPEASIYDRIRSALRRPGAGGASFGEDLLDG
ncbi:hypothetical protein [Cryptosporangium aurantiacum]|uniref:Uncharacterized protein n=1 Tax=Cryptosporangium aurantiacum TaxID=134849 RepID=A0A1M7K2F0_9ACTN|nr:hypothetical protein [Cryptosporangium aurantiacum]SHM59459.1 hypothetical protein SAMN05443668_101982 [Cryptosporangium aurantiacum]